MNAIETRYANCRFRSRLEARYAVFFTRLGIQWQYEPEGYALEIGPYLPDFFLPRFGVYVEIKPTWETARPFCKVLRSFRDEVGAILLFVGTPVEVVEAGGRPRIQRYCHWTGAGLLFCVECCDSSGGSAELEAFLGADRDHEAVLNVLAWKDRTLYRCHNMVETIKRAIVCQSPEGRDMAIYAPYSAAIEAARSARFEHGETPSC